MAGVSLVGLSGSMIKDSIKEPNGSTLQEFLQSEPVEEPELTKVLVGAFRSFCAAGPGYHLTVFYRRVLHSVRPNFVRINFFRPLSYAPWSTAHPRTSADVSLPPTVLITPPVHSTATQFVIEGVSRVFFVPPMMHVLELANTFPYREHREDYGSLYCRSAGRCRS